MHTPHPLRPQFWQHYTLNELNPTEWEALCDGCGLCCLMKLEDEDTEEVVYTRIGCYMLCEQTGHCKDYAHRKQHVPDCIELTPGRVLHIKWLPSTCAYARIARGKPLPTWHPLLTGNPLSVKKARISVAGKFVPETEVVDEDWEEYVIKWVDIAAPISTTSTK